MLQVVKDVNIYLNLQEDKGISMSKKNTFIKLSAVTAFIGGVYAFSDYIYKISTKPHEHRMEKRTMTYPSLKEGSLSEIIQTDRTFSLNQLINLIFTQATFLQMQNPTTM